MTTPDPIKFLTDDRKLDAELLVEMGVKATNHDAIGPDGVRHFCHTGGV